MTDFAFRDDEDASQQPQQSSKQPPPPPPAGGPPATTSPAPASPPASTPPASTPPATAGPAGPAAPRAPAPQVPLPTAPAPPLPNTSAVGPVHGGARPAAPPSPGQAAPRTATPQAVPKTAPSPPLPGTVPPAQPAQPSRGAATAPRTQVNNPVTGELARVALKTSAREQVENKDVPQWRVWLDKLDPFAFWLIRMGGLAAALSLAYLLWGVFDGDIGGQPGNVAQTVQNVSTAALILKWSLVVMAASLIVLMLDEKFVGVVLAVLGGALLFGAPLALKSLGQSASTSAIAHHLMSGGQFLLIVGLVKEGLDVAHWLSDLPGRMKQRADVGVAQLAEPAQQRTARYATMFSPCWQLPFCREVIRKQCPAYLAKKRCWKFGRGCYCDEEMISRIIRGESIELIKAPTRMSRQGKPPCGRCYIFLEHQSLKYKMISPLAIPATFAIMFFGWPFYEKFFKVAGNSLEAVWDRLSFSATQTATPATPTDPYAPPTPDIYTLSPEYVEQAAQTMFGVLLGFFVLIYLSKFIEWLIFKAKV